MLFPPGSARQCKTFPVARRARIFRSPTRGTKGFTPAHPCESTTNAVERRLEGNYGIVQCPTRRLTLPNQIPHNIHLERTGRVRRDKTAQRRSHLRRRHARQQHFRARTRQREEQDHRAVQDLAGEGGFDPQAQSRWQGPRAGHGAGTGATGGGAVLARLRKRVSFRGPFSFLPLTASAAWHTQNATLNSTSARILISITDTHSRAIAARAKPPTAC
jgi:hypothetical protein